MASRINVSHHQINHQLNISQEQGQDLDLITIDKRKQNKINNPHHHN